MANNTLRVTLTAKDEASAVLDAFKRRLTDVETPAKSMGRALETVNQRNQGLTQFSRSLTLPSITHGFQSITRESYDAFRNIGRLGEGMGALTEIAGLGTLGIGAMGAGAFMLTKHWSDVGSSLKFTAANIGITVGQLYRYRRVADLAGVSGDTMTEGLGNLQMKLWDAAGGRDPAMVSTLRYLGIHAGVAHGKIKPLASLLPEIADKIDAIRNPQAQVRVAEALGFSPAMMPLLRRGGGWIRSHMAELKRQGLTSAEFDGADKLRMDLSKLDTAALQLGYSLAQKFAPAVDTVTNDLIYFIDRLPSWLNKGAQYYNNALQGAESAGTYVHDKATGAWKWVSGTWDRLTGFKGAQNPYGLVHPAFTGAMDQKTVSALVNANAAKEGLRPAWMRALVKAEGGTGQISSAGAIGTMQLMPGTAQQMRVDPWNEEQNVKGGMGYFRQLLDQFHGNYPVAAAAYNAGPNGPGVQYFAQTGDERFLPPETRAYVDKIEKSAVTIDINHNNVPPGVSAKATTSGDGASIGKVKISRAMPEAAQ